MFLPTNKEGEYLTKHPAQALVPTFIFHGSETFFLLPQNPKLPFINDHLPSSLKQCVVRSVFCSVFSLLLPFLWWREGSELAGDPYALYQSLLLIRSLLTKAPILLCQQLVQIARNPLTFPESDVSFSCRWCLLSVLIGSLGPCLGRKCWKAGEVGLSLASSARAVCFSGVVPGTCRGVHIGVPSVWPPVVLASCGVALLIVYSFIPYPDVFLESRIPVKMMIQPLLPGDGGTKGTVAV